MHQLVRLDANVGQSSGTPEEVLAYISHRLDEINTIRRSIDDEELLLKARRNSFVPINRLPNEIMVKLLVLYEEYWYGRPQIAAPVAWIRVTSVCRHWHNVACATPLLWSTIEVSKTNVAWLDLCLARSAMASLSLSLRSPSDELLSRVASHSRRIKRLTVMGAWNSRSLSFLRGSMPLLETLDITAITPEVAPDFFDFEMSPRNYPFLRVLEITSIDSIPRNAESYTGLRQLSLSTCWLDISLDQFLDIMSACTCLESLSLNDFFAGLAHQGRTSRLGPAPWRPLISLPQLTTLMLEDEFHHDVARFLAHLVLSPAVELGIHAVFHPSGGPARMSAALPANRATTLPLLSTVTSVELDMSPDEYVLRAAKDAIMRNDDAVLSLVSTEHVDWYDYLRHGLSDLVNIFRAAPLTRLSVAGNYDCVADPNDWRTVFAAFPKLRELECYAFGTSSTTLLWTVLSHNEAAQAVPCPELQSIRMYGCRIKGSQEAGSFFDSMHACLRSRTMPEGRGMQRLDLEVQSQGQELDERLRWDYGPTLQSLVDEVRLNFKPYY